jgi:homeobox-leucine zipper protein
MRELVKKSSYCPSCGVLTSSGTTSAATTEEQLLRLENAKLKAEVRIACSAES